MWEKINNFLKGQIVTSLIYIVLGVCLVFMPVNTINVICKFVFGILLILVGLYHIVIYVAEKLNSTIFDLFSGGILMVLGIFLFMNPQIVVKLLPILLGTFILVDSIWTLKGSFKLKKRGVDTWRILLFGSLIFIALGISLVVNPFTMVKYTVIFAGWIFLCNGIIDLIYLVLLKKGGLISLCIYSGGDSGFEERNAVLDWLKNLDSHKYLVIRSDYYNRPNNPPIPVLIIRQ